MTAALIEVGPVTVHGPRPVPWQRAVTAVECIDDPTALVDDVVVTVEDLWVEVLRTAAGSACDDVVLVCPTWWTDDRTARVRAAAVTAFPEPTAIAVRHRVEALGAGSREPRWAVVEIAEELVFVSRGCGGGLAVVRADAEGTAAAVVDALADAGEVIIDAPAEVGGATALGHSVAAGLPGGGVVVVMADGVQCAPAERRVTVCATPGPAHGRGWIATGAGLVVAALCGAFAVTSHRPGTEVVTAALVEGRVGLQVPAAWKAERLPGGAGSARVQLTSPTDPEVALQLTQSGIAPGQDVAAVLQRVLAEQPPGIFVGFNPHDQVAGRAAITYRELRERHHVQWIILVDKNIRIAIGCQSTPQHPEAVRRACDDAVRTAHAEP